MYSQMVMEHFNDPRNVGEIVGYSAMAEGSAGGDVTFIYLQVRDRRIQDIKFKTFGNAAAIAAASMLTTMARGLPLAEAKDITPEQLTEGLGGLPEDKLPCAALATDTLKHAIEDYEAKRP